jgi:ATP-dependent helicase/nuclease subunit A
VWLEPLAGCVPSELRERAEEVLRRDREEGQRLAYVAATRAKDLLVVPVVGDEQRESWLAALDPVVFPAAARKRDRFPAPGCPAFGEDSVLARGKDTERAAFDSVMPGLHTPQAGAHRVVWWDPRVLELDRELGGGFRQRQVLQADETGAAATASIAAHQAWQERRAGALVRGIVPTREVRSITAAAKGGVNAGWDPVAIVDTGIVRAGRPRGKRFGILVHAVMAGIELDAGGDAIRALVHAHGRVVGAPPEELEAAVTAVAAALAHPLITRAREAPSLRREVPVVLHTSEGMLEGIIDLAFGDATKWTVIDFKTDAELDGLQQQYEMQVRLYAQAIAHATGLPTDAALLIV